MPESAHKPAAESDQLVHWPRTVDPGLQCSCNGWSVSGVRFDEAQRRWWQHVTAVLNPPAGEGR